ncbi:hypothetical protein GWI33_001436 [Rhynchophorus ferrugineus]|uniref:Uncharacterized protein n=1 Tax=Rhynchophorus ferrugineus TaxID=354439 RepID=A0A834IZY0_RHYFE|nr:hypothetical protein GWI33_001436 [Rhynchophorus ferrugineus]
MIQVGRSVRLSPERWGCHQRARALARGVNRCHLKYASDFQLQAPSFGRFGCAQAARFNMRPTLTVDQSIELLLALHARYIFKTNEMPLLSVICVHKLTIYQ